MPLAWLPWLQLVGGGVALGVVVLAASSGAQWLLPYLTRRPIPPEAALRLATRRRTIQLSATLTMGLVFLTVNLLAVARLPLVAIAPLPTLAVTLTLFYGFRYARGLVDGAVIGPQVARHLAQTTIRAHGEAGLLARARAFALLPAWVLMEAIIVAQLLGWSAWAWLAPGVAALWALSKYWLNPTILRWFAAARPIAATDYAALESRYRAWGDLAGVSLGAVVVLPHSGNVAIMAGRRPSLVLGAHFLRQSDWRQQDAVVGHEFGHARQRHTLWVIVLRALGAGCLSAAVTGVIILFGAGGTPQPPLTLGIVGASLVVWSAVTRVTRRFSYQFEYECDQASIELAGDPLALLTALHTINSIMRSNPSVDGLTHPSTKRRGSILERRLKATAAGLAPWAYVPVPAVVTLRLGERLLTAPLRDAPPPAPVPPRPWSAMPAPVANMVGGHSAG